MYGCRSSSPPPRDHFAEYIEVDANTLSFNDSDTLHLRVFTAQIVVRDDILSQQLLVDICGRTHVLLGVLNVIFIVQGNGVKAAILSSQLFRNTVSPSSCRRCQGVAQQSQENNAFEDFGGNTTSYHEGVVHLININV